MPKAPPTPAGVILPKDVLARLRAGVGDTLHITEVPDGVRLTVHDPDFAADMEMAEEIMREDRRILRALAK
ncbi:MAG: AbrB/MazE/SpoVT family DNA-binding domain-containing protein [Novosphingobium sp.]|nr:AbrB/MazE/SpoVT family DNA-binding domain-containing protein [Novosphingobium sp.]